MKCILCQNSLLSTYSTTSYLGLPIYHCQNCELFITGSSENELSNKLEEFYKKEYWNKKDITPEETLVSNYTDINSRSKRRQWISQFAYCKPYFTKNQTLFEIGSGMGQSLFWFEQSGFSVTGVEPDGRNVELINKKLIHGKCIQGDIEQIDIKGEFDIIWISHVLEHLIRPDLLLKRLKENLNVGGILFVEVPSCENEKVLYDSIYTQPHTYHFSKKSLLNLAERSGYNIQKCDHVRPATYREAATNRIFTKYLKVNAKFLYYPRVITEAKNAVEIRMILQ